MAQVQPYAPGQVAPAQPVLATQTAPNFNAGTDAVVGGLKGVADTASQVIGQQQTLLNETNAKNLDNQASDQIRALLHGPNGLLAKQGADAVGAQGAFTEDLDNVTKSTLDAAKTPLEKQMLQQTLNARRADALNLAASHVSAQANVYAQATDEASIKGFATDAQQSPDEKHSEVLIGAMNARIAQNYGKRGIAGDPSDPNSPVAQAQREATSNVLAGRVTALLSSKDTGQQALALLNSYGDRIEPVTFEALRKTAIDAANDASVSHNGRIMDQGGLPDWAQHVGEPAPVNAPPGAPPASSAPQPGASLNGPVKLQWPVPGYTGVSAGGGFDAMRVQRDASGNQIGGAYLHHGIDVHMPVGTPVMSAGSGRVVFAGNQGGAAGNEVVVDHGGGVVTTYMHLSQLSVKTGQQLDGQTPIGQSGGAKGAPGAGDSTGPHLHYQVMVKGSYVNPMTARAIPGPSSQPTQPGLPPAETAAGNVSSDGSLVQAKSDPRTWTDRQINAAANTWAGGSDSLYDKMKAMLLSKRSEASQQYSQNTENNWQAVQPYITGPDYTDPSQIPANLRASLRPDQARSVTDLATSNADAKTRGTDRVDNWQTVGAYQTLAMRAAADPNGRAANGMTNLQAFVTRDPTRDAADLSGPRINDIRLQQQDAAQQRGPFAPHKTGTPIGFASELLSGPAAIVPPTMSKQDRVAFGRVLYDTVTRASRNAPLDQDDVRNIGLRLLGQSSAKDVFGGDVPLWQFRVNGQGSAATVQNADLVPTSARAAIIAAWKARNPTKPISEGEILNAWRTRQAVGQ